MKGTIELTGMRFHAFHGCLEREKTEGGEFLVDVSLRTDITAAAAGDSLDDTVDYSRVYDIVAGQMSQASNLLENVAARIASAIRSAFPEAESVEVKVSKKKPPLAGPAEWSSVSVCL